MLVLVVVLVVTNVVTLGVLAYFALRPGEHPAPDATLARTLDRLPPAAPSSVSRRVISVEILNPIEVAATRGRLAGIAGSLAPGLIRRIVYDQTIKTMRRHLADEQVVADLRLHTLRAPERPTTRSPVTRSPARPPTPVVDNDGDTDLPADVPDGRPRRSGVDGRGGARPGA